jgi:hypothetical protein
MPPKLLTAKEIPAMSETRAKVIAQTRYLFRVFALIQLITISAIINN